MEKKKIEFGQKVLVKNKLKRRQKTVPTSNGSRTKKLWEENPFKDFEPTEGMFLGYRTVSDGYRRIWSDHIEYNAIEHYTVALVAIGPNTNPFYASEIEIINED